MAYTFIFSTVHSSRRKLEAHFHPYHVVDYAYRIEDGGYTVLVEYENNLRRIESVSTDELKGNTRKTHEIEWV